MSIRDETVSFSMEVNVGIAEDQVRAFETVFYRALRAVKRLTGQEDLNVGIATMQRAIVVANSLRLAYRALQRARLAAGDPVAWAMFGLSMLEVGFSASDVALEM